MSLVTVVYGNQIQSMVQYILADTKALDALRPHDRVVIKPNLVASRREWQGVNTDPQVVEAFVQVLKEHGISHITVGDGSGMGYNARKAFQVCGYNSIARRYDVKLVDLERDRFVKKPVAIDGPFRSLEIAQTVVDCDFLINMPVMKAHSQTLITCSLKNMKGVMPRSLKTGFHGVDLHKAIAQLNSVIAPDFILVDGMQGDLSSELGRNPVKMERMLLGDNPVEVDSVVADMLGYAPRDIRHISHSADARLGSCDLNEIERRALNQPMQDIHFTPPVHYSKRFPCQIHAEGACCSCMGNLIFALERLNDERLLSRKQQFFVGQGRKIVSKNSEVTVAIGKCAVKQVDADIFVQGCPPSGAEIYQQITQYLR